MPSYKQSKSQKRSQSQSKNGGRRRKHTMRKLRRGKKSRKVMRGGIPMWSQLNKVNEFSRPELVGAIKEILRNEYGNTHIPDTLSRTEILTKLKQSDMFTKDPEYVITRFSKFYDRSDFDLQ